MSHFTRVRTQLRDLDTVRRALEDLGFEVVENAPVRGYNGQQERADLVVQTGSEYNLGFRREGQNVVMVADFWGLRIDREGFLNRVTQRYAYLTVLDQAQKQGWQSVAEEVQEDGSIRLVMQRWG
ncbi:MAG TPA: DUF1257 domain-containing protein [Aggregatilineales bacterium]|jgi:hypothetical protein|nr:DUF1257 domain-containing protein [Chloroflexota bacterium]HOA23390.1 DUF1257 domain-containing protein [Aggregatilineales bacterium]HPV07038.1 DUF1257 domain-containing protein [Aggregatilineales bacterium]HQA69508.1 DUF1257 domain-containing protein [Aggregatilineales bacterium]HQE18568.1 DUF1257 domain-containing protein [Aggregatilineales bacterium]